MSKKQILTGTTRIEFAFEQHEQVARSPVWREKKAREGKISKGKRRDEENFISSDLGGSKNKIKIITVKGRYYGIMNSQSSRKKPPFSFSLPFILFIVLFSMIVKIRALSLPWRNFYFQINKLSRLILCCRLETCSRFPSEDNLFPCTQWPLKFGVNLSLEHRIITFAFHCESHKSVKSIDTKGGSKRIVLNVKL